MSVERGIVMAKGSTGAETNIIIKVKKAEQLRCDCERCKHSKRGAGTIYCTYYDEFSPTRKTCARYWCVKPVPKSRKSKTQKKAHQKK